MPRTIIPKPTVAEKKAATNLQAPPPRSKKTATAAEATETIPKFRKLSDVGIDGSQKSFLKVAQLFTDDDADVSEPFIITGARVMPNTLKPGTFQVVFSIQTKGEEGMEDYKIGMAQDDSRMEYVAYFQTNTVPLGWLELHKIEAQKVGHNPYYAIHQVPDDDIPF